MQLFSDSVLRVLSSPRLKHDSMLCLNLSHVSPQRQPPCSTLTGCLADPPQNGSGVSDARPMIHGHWGTNTSCASPSCSCVNSLMQRTKLWFKDTVIRYFCLLWEMSEAELAAHPAPACCHDSLHQLARLAHIH